MFVRINTSKKDLALMAEHYGVRALPTYMIFRYGRPVRGARKEGFLRGYDLQLFIDEHLGSTINGYVQEKAAKKRRRNNRRSYTYVGYGVGGYPYGYYGYPYYGYGGGIGFGVGF